MRERPPPDPPEDVPLWFMTYSDVITLMMTFFILLLTFASSEPERFEQMKISVFGGNGASGLAGKRPDGLEKDSWSVRVRPRSSRLTDRGSEVPPIEKDAPMESLGKGLAGLEENEQRQTVEIVTIVVPGNSIGSRQGELYEFGEHNMKMLANMIQTHSYQVTFEVSGNSQLNRALACMEFLYNVHGIDADQLSVCKDQFKDLSREKIRMILRQVRNRINVKEQEKASQ